MDEKIQEIISKNAYMQRMIKRIPEEMVSYYLEKIKDNIVELPGGIIHSQMGQNGEYMNFALPMGGNRAAGVLHWLHQQYTGAG